MMMQSAGLGGDLGRRGSFWQRYRRRSSGSAVAVSHNEIAATRALLEQLGTKIRGGSLEVWQKRRIAQLAPRVAMRRKMGIKPTLSRRQAMSLFSIISR